MLIFFSFKLSIFSWFPFSVLIKLKHFGICSDDHHNILAIGFGE
jgi:hypothetical protein